MSSSLFDPRRAVAIVLGAREFPKAVNLEVHGIRFSNSALAFRKYLIENLGIPRRHIIDLFDDAGSPDQLLGKIRDFLDRRIHELRSTPLQDLFLYYVGHGFLEGRGVSDLHLAIRETDTEELSYTALDIRSLASVIRSRARFVRRYLILDCCYAAAASRAWSQADGPARIAMRNALAVLPAESPTRGTAVLSAADSDREANALGKRELTAFSDGLLHCLEQGREDIGERISLGALHWMLVDYLRNTYSESNIFVRPKVESPEAAEGDVAWLPVFPNPAYRTVAEHVEGTEGRGPELARQQREEEERKQAELARQQREEEERKQAELARLQREEEERKQTELARQEREEEERKQAELARQQREEEERKQAELARQQREEEERKQAELAHQQREEEERKQAELARQQREEEERKQAELAHQQREEEERKQTELARQQREEEERKQAELARQQREEEERKQAELARQQREEEERKQAELARQQREEEEQPEALGMAGAPLLLVSIIVCLTFSLVGGWLGEVFGATAVGFFSVASPSLEWVIYFSCGTLVSCAEAASIWTIVRKSQHRFLLLPFWISGWTVGWAVGAHFDLEDSLTGFGSALSLTSMLLLFRHLRTHFQDTH